MSYSTLLYKILNASVYIGFFILDRHKLISYMSLRKEYKMSYDFFLIVITICIVTRFVTYQRASI